MIFQEAGRNEGHVPSSPGARRDQAARHGPRLPAGGFLAFDAAPVSCSRVASVVIVTKRPPEPPMPLALTDAEFAAVQAAAAPIHPMQRDAFLKALPPSLSVILSSGRASCTVAPRPCKRSSSSPPTPKRRTRRDTSRQTTRDDHQLKRCCDAISHP
jgi:hypothetical protein